MNESLLLENDGDSFEAGGLVRDVIHICLTSVCYCACSGLQFSVHHVVGVVRQDADKHCEVTFSAKHVKLHDY